MLCGWEGNRRSGVTLAMRHRLQWFIHLRAHGLRKGDDHPIYAAYGVLQYNGILYPIRHYTNVYCSTYLCCVRGRVVSFMFHTQDRRKTWRNSIGR